MLLAAGVRLSEDPAVAAAARAVRTRPLEHAAAAAGWAAQALWSGPRARADGDGRAATRGEALAMIRIRDLEKAVRSGTGLAVPAPERQPGVEKGDFLTLMGPSGAGKSTLLAVLGMLDADWTGEYELDGQRVDRMSAKERQALARRHVGFVFQRYHLLDDLTVAENLEVPLGYRGVSPQGDPGPGGGHARPVPHRRKEGPLPVPALRRAAAAGGGGPGHHPRAQPAAGRRAHRATCTRSRRRKSWRCSGVSTAKAPPSSR